MDETKPQARQDGYILAIEKLNGGGLRRIKWQSLYEILGRLSEGVETIVQPIKDPWTPTNLFNKPTRPENHNVQCG
jgi:antirestriction protein ArdC